MTEPDENQADDTKAAGEGTAYDPIVKTEDNTGGFKPGRDEPQEDED